MRRAHNTHNTPSPRCIHSHPYSHHQSLPITINHSQSQSALCNLFANNDVSSEEVGALGAIPALVDICKKGSDAGKETAARGLWVRPLPSAAERSVVLCGIVWCCAVLSVCGDVFVARERAAVLRARAKGLSAKLWFRIPSPADSSICVRLCAHPLRSTSPRTRTTPASLPEMCGLLPRGVWWQPR